jgi:hypothetical protein
MPQPGFTPLILYGSSTTGHVPTHATMNVGELAVNVIDALLWTDNGTSIVPLTGTIAPQSANAVTITGGTISVSTLTGTSSVSTPVLFSGTSSINIASRSTSSINMLVEDNGNPSVNYLLVQGANATNPIEIGVGGSDTNITLAVSSKGTNSINFYTRGFTSFGFAVVDNGAAVTNYVVASGGNGNVYIQPGNNSQANCNLNLSGIGTGHALVNGAVPLSAAVTSITAGTGLTGGTITSTGTINLATQSFNGIGTYAIAYYNGLANTMATVGSNYSGSALTYGASTLSGSWTCMGPSQSGSVFSGYGQPNGCAPPTVGFQLFQRYA